MQIITKLNAHYQTRAAFHLTSASRTSAKRSAWRHRAEAKGKPVAPRAEATRNQMKSMTETFASLVAVAVALMMGAVVPAAAQQTSQDYSTLPGYSARPPGMCWHKHPGHDFNGYKGYWEACTNTSTNTSGNQSVNSVRAQVRPPRREHPRAYSGRAIMQAPAYDWGAYGAIPRSVTRQRSGGGYFAHGAPDDPPGSAYQSFGNNQEIGLPR